MEIENLAFESKEPDRGYTVRAKVWNIAAHFRDIVDGEIEKSASGYEMATDTTENNYGAASEKWNTH